MYALATFVVGDNSDRERTFAVKHYQSHIHVLGNQVEGAATGSALGIFAFTARNE